MNKTWGWISFVLFCVGVLLAVIGGLMFPENAWIGTSLGLIGLIIGIIHVCVDREGKGSVILLLATIALLSMTAAFSPLTFFGFGKLAAGVLVNFASLMSPVAIIAAIKAVLKLFLEPQVKI